MASSDNSCNLREEAGHRTVTERSPDSRKWCKTPPRSYTTVHTHYKAQSPTYLRILSNLWEITSNTHTHTHTSLPHREIQVSNERLVGTQTLTRHTSSKHYLREA